MLQAGSKAPDFMHGVLSRVSKQKHTPHYNARTVDKTIFQEKDEIERRKGCIVRKISHQLIHIVLSLNKSSARVILQSGF